MTLEKVLPVVLQLLRDSESEVRLKLVSNLQKVHDVLGVELLSQSLVPAIVHLADDAKWRVRGAIIDHMPSVAHQLGSNFFDDRLCQSCVRWLDDDVDAIRRKATRNLVHDSSSQTGKRVSVLFVHESSRKSVFFHSHEIKRKR